MDTVSVGGIPAEVTLTIYGMNGHLVRRLAVGYQAAGMYQSRSRAAYWDGRNQLGESVASGLYFYTLTADDFTATRRMLILKCSSGGKFAYLTLVAWYNNVSCYWFTDVLYTYRPAPINRDSKQLGLNEPLNQ